MADLGNIYGASGRSLVESATGEINNYTKVSSDFSKNAYIKEAFSFDSTDLEGRTNISNFNIQTVQNYYSMRGRDVDCGVITYRFWTVSGSPDKTGALYSGAKCGASPLADIIVLFKYTA